MPPKQISVKEILEDLRKGVTDREIKSKYELSDSQLHSIFKKLVQAGHLTQSDLDNRPKEPEPERPDLGTVKPPVDGRNVKKTAVPAPSIPPKGPDFHRLRQNTVFGLTIGILCQIAGIVVASPGIEIMWLGGLLLAVGYALFIWGCHSWALKKGYSPALALFGILSCFGLIVLFVLPDRNASSKSAAAVLLVVIAGGFVVVTLFGIIAAISVPYYVSRNKIKCDREAQGGVEKVQQAFEKIRNEASASNLGLDNKALEKIADGNALKYLVGPHYKWRGSNKGCGVLMRMVKKDGEWIMESTALKGSHPSGAGSRYVYSASLTSNKQQKSKVARGIADAGNGHAQSWNSYPPGNEDLCYSESIVGTSSSSPPGFNLARPQGFVCPKSMDFK